MDNNSKKSYKDIEDSVYKSYAADVSAFKDRLKLLTGSVVITAATILIFKYLFGYVWPFLVAYIIAIAIERPVKRLSGHMWNKKGLAAALIVILLTVVFAAIITYLIYMGIHELKLFIRNYDFYVIVLRQHCARLCLDIDSLMGLRQCCCMDFMERCFTGMTGSLTDSGGFTIANKVIKVSVPFAIWITKVAGSLIVCIMSVVYLAGVLDKIRMWRQTTVFKDEVQAVTLALKNLLNVYFKIQLIIMAINSSISIAGLLIIHNSYAVIIGILIGLIDALPIFGTGTVLIPWSLILLLLRDVRSAAVLMTVYIVTYFVREIMESKCMGDKMGIAPFTMLMIIFVGILIYGIMGFILGPVSYVIIKALIGYLKTIIERGTLKKYGC